jgi:secreted trypsin-like serine protease
MFANLHPSGSMIISNFLYPQNKYNQQRKGGPLIIPGSTAAEDVLVGVTSWGIGCATKVFPGVFSRVSYAYDWIAETVCSESSNAPRYLCETPEPTLKPTEKPISAAPTPEAS